MLDASRAGCQGRELASAATEIRCLALQSAAAAKAIRFLSRNAADGCAVLDGGGHTTRAVACSTRQVAELSGPKGRRRLAA